MADKNETVEINISVAGKARVKVNQIDNQKNQPIQISPAGPKVKSQMSVAQLAYYSKVITEVGLIKTDKHVSIFKFIGEHYSSANKPNISAESFKRKFYNVEESTKLAVREHLQKMIDYIDNDLEDLE